MSECNNQTCGLRKKGVCTYPRDVTLCSGYVMPGQTELFDKPIDEVSTHQQAASRRKSAAKMERES